MAIDAHSTTAPAFQRALLRPTPCEGRVATTLPFTKGGTTTVTPSLPKPKGGCSVPPQVAAADVVGIPTTPLLKIEELKISDLTGESSAIALLRSDAPELQEPPLIDDVPYGGAGEVLPIGSMTATVGLRHGGAIGVSSTVETTPLDEAGLLRTEHTPAVLRDGRETPADVRHGGAPKRWLRTELSPQSSLDLASARHMRRALAEAVHHAIALMDALDAPGVDLEDGGEAEPSLGWIDGKPHLSDSHDDREAEADDEPMLGAPERSAQSGPWGPSRDSSGSQTDWADGSTRHDEAEAVNEDGGDILDEGEETLGWSANVGQLALGMTTADGDETALERHGQGFIRSGGDDTEDSDPSGGRERDEDALFWSLDVGCAIGAPVDGDGAHG